MFTLSLQDNVDCDMGDEYCSDLDGEFFELFNSPIRTSNKNAGNEWDNLAHKVHEVIVDGLDYLSQQAYEVIDFYNFSLLLYYNLFHNLFYKFYQNGVVNVDKLSDEDLSEVNT